MSAWYLRNGAKRCLVEVSDQALVAVAGERADQGSRIISNIKTGQSQSLLITTKLRTVIVIIHFWEYVIFLTLNQIR